MEDALKFWGSKGCHQDTKKRNPDRKESHWNNVKQEVIFQVPQGRGLKIRNCTFRSNFKSIESKQTRQRITLRNQRQQRSKTVATTRVLGKQREHQRHRKGLLRKLVAAHWLSSGLKYRKETWGTRRPGQRGLYMCIVGGLGQHQPLTGIHVAKRQAE